MSDRGSRDGSEQWRPWQMDELERPADSAQPDQDNLRREAIRRQAFRRNAELEALRRQAHEQARQQGHEEGFAAGRAEGYAQGLEEGRRAGEQELQLQIAQTLQPLRQLAEEFRKALAHLDEQIADQLVGLAMATGRHLAGEALQTHPEQILAIVRELLHAEPALTGKPRLWLHPADLLLVRAHLGNELAAAGWQLQPDELVSRGGCRVNSASGELDATWESRWDSLLEQLRHRQSPGASHTAP